MADQTSSSSPSSSLSNLIRLAPLQVSDLPGHPDLPGSGSSADLSALVTALLDDGASFLSRSTFGRNFKHHSTKPSPPSAARVEVLNHTVPANAIAQLQWTRGSSHQPDSNINNNSNNGGVGVSRSKPLLKTGDEHWFARRSVHRDISSKSKDTPGHASWDEFVFGLRDEHSKHEMEFTPTLYDARPVADWKGQIHKMEEEGQGGGFGFGFKGKEARYTNVSLGVYEMCHAIPPPLMPRCFCVLVATASITGESGEDEFIAVTVPVDLTGGATAAGAAAGAGTRTGTDGESEKSVGFYSTGRNMREGEDPQRRKKVLMGLYTAVEAVRRRDRERGGEIEWIMATSSDAKGNLPIWLQKMSLPGAIAKDVGFFLKWIKDVDVDVDEGEAMATATTRRG